MCTDLNKPARKLLIATEECEKLNSSLFTSTDLAT